MSGWQDVLDVQLGLIRFWRSPAGERSGDLFGESMRRVEREDGATHPDAALSENIAVLQYDTLARADPFYVDDDMMDLLEAAAEDFQPEPLAESDLLTPHSFIVLPRPLYVFDRHSQRISYRAILLRSIRMKDLAGDGPAKQGLLVSLYSHLDDEDDAPASEELRQMILSRDMTPYLLMHTLAWPFGTDYPGDSVPGGPADWWRQVQALLRLSLQTIADRQEERPPRGAGRRWKREFHEDRYVTVIRLRRPRHKGEPGGATVEWSHQWIVGGHWRNQWFPSLGLHRQIYIGAHVKGPEDKPLLVRRMRAFELVR